MSVFPMPKAYENKLDVRKTQHAIKKVKDFFERELATQLNLIRVSAPLFVKTNSGMNDTLNGIERPVSFDIKGDSDEVQVVQSLAKWKRYALGRYGFSVGEGLYTDMSAIRRDEDTDNIHSIYVDQWDWERVLDKSDRTEKMLYHIVRGVYRALRHTEAYIAREYDFANRILPKDIFMITSQELEDLYPDLTPKQREYEIVKQHGAVFISKIGGVLRSGNKHDGRAPDYDDWELNGDIMVYYPILDIALELSSMGIRVDEETLKRQLDLYGCPERAELPFQKALLNGELPYTVGGGIGQSRMCMFFLRKAHIGEVQSSVWSDEDQKTCAELGITLL